MKDEGDRDATRRAILARRAKFVTVALAGAGLTALDACQQQAPAVCLEMAVPPSAEPMPRLEPAPTPCLEVAPLPPDAGVEDAGGKDAGGKDAGGRDAGREDGANEDASAKDAGTPRRSPPAKPVRFPRVCLNVEQP